MISKEVIVKSIDEAIIKCGKPKFESMHTPKQIARYFGLKYEELDEIPKDTRYYDYYQYDDEENWKGKVHKFTDPKNEDCPIYIFDSMFDRKTGLLKSEGYDDRIEHPEFYDEVWEEVLPNITYPLKDFINDYNDLPDEFKGSIGELVFDFNDGGNAEGRCVCDNGKSLIILYKNSAGINGYDDIIYQTPRTVLFHEVGHSISHRLGYYAEDNEDIYPDLSADYLGKYNKDYKRGRRKDKKLNGDKYATEYGESSKNFTEEQADVTMAMLLKALSKNDSKYNNYYMSLAFNKETGKNEDINIDDFLARYPNRVSALNKYLKLEL